jgi:hypothetical protein
LNTYYSAAKELFFVFCPASFFYSSYAYHAVLAHPDDIVAVGGDHVLLEFGHGDAGGVVPVFAEAVAADHVAVLAHGGDALPALLADAVVALVVVC